MPDVNSLLLVSHNLCPYVQRAVIALTEKGVAFERRYIDLAAKPDWFLDLSPTGKTPLLVVAREPVFESNVILEYLEETQPHPLHPRDPLMRARHRGWLEFASVILNDIAGLYNADTDERFAAGLDVLADRFTKVEAALAGGPYFGGDTFSLVDAAFGPVFRYFDVFEQIADVRVFDGVSKTAEWRHHLAARESVKQAVSSNYAENLLRFLQRKRSVLGGLARSVEHRERTPDRIQQAP